MIDIADRVLSTGKMIRESRITRQKDVIIGTEAGIVYRLNKENLETRFHPVKDLALCYNMKKITLPKVWRALKDMVFKVKVPPEISKKARGAIEKMVKL